MKKNPYVFFEVITPLYGLLLYNLPQILSYNRKCKPVIQNILIIFYIINSMTFIICFGFNNGSPAIFRGRLSKDSAQTIHEEGQI